MWQQVITAVWLLFLVGWFTVYAHAVQPKNGTLEWIRMYDRQQFTCLGDRGGLCRQDIAWLAGCVVLTGAWCLWGIGVFSGVGPAAVVLPIFAAAGVYLLSRMLHGGCLLSALAALTVPLSVEGLCSPVILAAVLFYGWMSQPADAPVWKNILWMLGAGLIAWAALLLSPGLWWMLPVVLLAWIVVLILRWRAGVGGKKLTAMVLLSLLWSAVLVLLFLVGWLVRSGGLQLADLPQALWDGRLVQNLALLGADLWDQIFQWSQDPPLWIVLDHSGVVLAGLFAWVALLLDAIRRHSVGSAWMFALTCGALAAYLLGGAPALLCVFAVDIALIADRLWNREKKIAAVLLPALTLAIEIGNQFFGI